jgi:hypothetical protein
VEPLGTLLSRHPVEGQAGKQGHLIKIQSSQVYLCHTAGDWQ